MENVKMLFAQKKFQVKPVLWSQDRREGRTKNPGPVVKLPSLSWP